MEQPPFNMEQPLANGLTAVTVCVPIYLSESDVLTDWPSLALFVWATYSWRYSITGESFPS